MNEILAVVSGVLIAVMVFMNGELSATYGSMHATVFIHVVGLAGISLLMLVRRKNKQEKKPVPWYLWLGGCIGVFTVVSNILTFPVLGVSLTLGFGVLGQCLISIVIDRFGWFGVPKQSFSPHRLAGLGVIAAGVALMLL